MLDEFDYEQDADFEPSLEDDYAEAVQEVYPDIQDALQWASYNLSPEQIADYNQMVDSGDPDAYMELLENIYEQYEEARGLFGTDDSDAYEPEDDEEIEVTDEDYNNVVEDLQAAEPQGQEAAMPFLEAAVSSQGVNPLYSDWMAATARFHAGEIDWNDALDEMTAKYSISDLAKMYNYLNND